MSSTRPDPITAPTTPPVPAASSRPALDDSRPFGAHLRMSWWKPLIILVVPLLIMFVGQIVLTVAVLFVEVAAFDRDPFSTAMTPLMMLAGNLSLILMAPISVLLTAWLGKVPWRRLFSTPRRFSWARVGVYLAMSAVLVLLGLGFMVVVMPEHAGLAGFAVTGTTVALLAVIVLTTPLQAAAEEITFRGSVMPAIASWIRPATPALVVGMAGSSIIFGLVHFSIDPWLLAYYTVIGVCMAVMAVISRGLEAPIAFHVANNMVLMVIGALFADGQAVEIDRSVGMGGPYMLVFIAVDLLAVAGVWLYERRLRASDHPSASSTARSLSA